LAGGREIQKNILRIQRDFTVFNLAALAQTNLITYASHGSSTDF
jgi:hypothetical protein